MSIKVQCSCGQWLSARNEFAGRRAQCPSCANVLYIPDHGEPAEVSKGAAASARRAEAGPSEPVRVREYLDPPNAPVACGETESATERVPVLRRMFEALLDPRSIQWMLMIGGGLCVLGLVIWLVSLGIFEDPRVLACTMGIGTLMVLAAGWFVTLRTRFRTAGQALTFLGCVIAPLNLWFYHAQDLITVEGHLWVAGVVCCLLYAATVIVLRDPLFMYAIEAGATLTLLLLLADLGRLTDPVFLSLFFMLIGLASVHAERAFSPSEKDVFTRRRFGLPLFWSGHVQIAVSLLNLLACQVLEWLKVPTGVMSNWTQEAQPLIENSILAGGLWLAATYVYLYSDIVVRRIGLYLALAGFSLVMAELTLLFGMNLQSEWVIAILALTALAINVFHGQFVTLNEKLDRVIPPLALVLSGLPLLCSLMLHFRATSTLAAEYHWSYPTGWAFVVAALIVAASNRISSYLCRKTNPRLSATYFAFNAAAVLIAVAGLLRELGIVTWSHQAPWLMVIPVVYLIASRLWRGHTAERPLAWIAQVATALILVFVLFTFRQEEGTSLPAKGEGGNLMLGLVFAEATIFYVLAGLFRKRSANVYLAAATACCALWQLLGYLGIDSRYHTMLYAVLGVACLAGARILGLEKATIFGDDGHQRQTINGRGRAVFQSGNGILIVACLAGFLQGLSGLHVGTATWFDLGALAVTTIASALAIGFVPSGTWRSLYTAATIALAAVAFLRLNLLIDLSNWQKLEIFCVTAGIVMLIASHIARFREIEGVRDETVSLGLWLGSMLATGPLLIAFSYHRWIGEGPSLQDEMALLTVTILMVVTGVSWQMKATTLCGGSLLTFYLIKLIVSLAYRPQVAIGVYLALGGAIIFAVGIALSIYREKLLVVSKQVSQREGIFQILTWR